MQTAEDLYKVDLVRPKFCEGESCPDRWLLFFSGNGISPAEI